MTKYEKEIYDIISASMEHLTVEQLFQQVRAKYPKVVLATIYNNVNKLCETGFIRRISIEGMPDRYDRIKRHDHLVCRRCGRLADISFDDLTAPLRQALGMDFLYYDLKVVYLCPACRKKEKEAAGLKISRLPEQCPEEFSDAHSAAGNSSLKRALEGSCRT